MVGRVVLWVLQLYYQAVEQWRLVWRVLAIQLRNPHRTVKGSLTAEHVAIRTSDTAVLRQDTLVALVRHLRRQLAVKYLTVLVGRAGFEREIAVEETDTAFFYNYEQIFVPTVRDMSVNIVDAEAETLFLAKVGECSQLRTDLSPEALVRQAAAVFSDFPPIDVYLCMRREMSFVGLHPLHLGFTHFYSCPVLASQACSLEAVSFGLECYSQAKQNYGH